MKRHLHVVAIAAVAGSLAAGAVQTLFSAWAVQNEIIPPTSGIYTGPQFSQLLGDAFRSVVGCNKGPTAPANVGGDVVDGLCWIDDSATPWIKKRYVNGGWAVEGALDPTDSSYAGVIGGGAASIASGATVDLGAVPQANVTITGTATIAGFGSAAPVGVIKFIRFDGAATLTHSSGLKVPGGYALTTAADDRAIVTHLGSGNWEITQYTRASGVPVDVSAIGKPDFVFGSVPPLHVSGYGQAIARASYPAYREKVTHAQTVTRTSGSISLSITASTAGLGVGMPIEGVGIPSGTTVAGFGPGTLVMSAQASSSGTAPIAVFLTGYGAGGDSTTVGVPDCRNRTLAGRDHDAPGALSNRLTTTYFGADSSVFNVSGNSSESVTMALGNLISHTHANTLSDPGHTHDLENSRLITDGNGGTAFVGIQKNNGYVPGDVRTTSNTTGVTITNVAAGSASPTPMRTVSPTLIAECVVRVTP